MGPALPAPITMLLHVICGSGAILLAYYTPPLFTNEDEARIEAKIIVRSKGESAFRISPDRPFRYAGWFSEFSRKAIEIGREYTLGVTHERYSPLRKPGFKSDATDVQRKSENKALVLKIKFGLIQDR